MYFLTFFNFAISLKPILGLEKTLCILTDCFISDESFEAKIGFTSSGDTLVFFKKLTNLSVSLRFFSTFVRLSNVARPILLETSVNLRSALSCLNSVLNSALEVNIL